MTDTAPLTSIRDIVAAKMAKRYRAEKRFAAFGLAMVAIAVLACGMLIVSILGQSIPALTEYRLFLTVDVTAAKADPAGKRDPLEIRGQGDFFGMVQDSLVTRFPTAEADGTIDDLFDVATSLAAVPIGKKIATNPDLIGKKLDIAIPINDDLDLFLKGAFGETFVAAGAGVLIQQQQTDGSFILSGQGNIFKDVAAKLRTDLVGQAAQLERGLLNKNEKLRDAQEEVSLLTPSASTAAPSEALYQAISYVASLESEIRADTNSAAAFKAAASDQSGVLTLGDEKPTLLIETNSGTYKIATLSGTTATAKVLVRTRVADNAGAWHIVQLASPQAGRAVNDETIAYGRQLKAQGVIRPTLNTTIFTNSDSNEPELSGLLSAFIGSLLTLAVTFCLAVPIGVSTAIYLEEFAPKNWLTDFVEVNINNLAAVPSIVFGLLGFAVFLTFFQMPRSAPIVGGIVLALMSLPVIIIASRAALKAVPPSIREAALGVGASKMQTIFHHVLPLATPGIMTGSILAMAHALGETAPLLMIGMVAFIADVPASLTDSATVLPVELFMWAGRPERAWEPRTALAIISLLVFMIFMNGIAIYVRRKFERRW